MNTNKLIENVRKFSFSIMGYITGSLDVTLELKNGKRTAGVKTVAGFGEYRQGKRTVSEEEWNRFFTKLFSECGVMDYPEEFDNGGLIIDGEYWSLTVEFNDGSIKSSGGNSVYPECWDEVMESIDMIAKK